MARLPNRKNQAIQIFTNGKRADNAYGLSDLVGQYVGRLDKYKQRAVAGLARRASPAASREVRKTFNVRAGQLTGKIRAVVTNDTVRVYAFDRRIPLIEFGGRWRGIKSPGATASIVRGQQEIYPQSFIATIQGRKSIRVRQKRGSRRAPRGPVQMLYGPSPREMIIGRKSNAETRDYQGFYSVDPRKAITAELVTYYVGELKRQLEVEARRG